MTNFIWAIQNGDLDLVKDFVENKGEEVNEKSHGRFPIHVAADYGQKEILQYLLDKGANVNTKDIHGITALLAAIWEGHTECVRLLLQKGADKNGSTPSGSSYLDVDMKSEIRALLE